MIKLFYEDFTGDLSKWNPKHFWGDAYKHQDKGIYNDNAVNLVYDAALKKQVLQIEARPKVPSDNISDETRYVVTGSINTLGKTELYYPYALRVIVKLPILTPGIRFRIGGWNEANPSWQTEFFYVECDGENPGKVFANYSSQWSSTENDKRVVLDSSTRNFIIDNNIQDLYHEYVFLSHSNYMAWYMDGFPIWSIPQPRLYDKWQAFYLALQAGYDGQNPATTFDPLYAHIAEFSIWALDPNSKYPTYPDFTGIMAPPNLDSESLNIEVITSDVKRVNVCNV